MNERFGLEGLKQIPRGSVVSIGNFDGVHRGHQRILESAQGLRSSSESSRQAVVTFEPHPLTVLRPERVPPRLTTAGMKRDLLAAAGVDEYVVLPPEPEVLNLSAEQFWEILRDDLHVAHLVEGESFYFGKNRGGSIQKLRQWTTGTSVQLHVVESVTAPLLDLKIAPVSSSLIRWLLQGGRVREAAICLGRPLILEGEVVQGYQRGRTIGVPTANLNCPSLMIPADGVYAARCSVEGVMYPVGLSIGTMPTFGENRRQIEAHLIGYSGDLYGQTLRVEVLDWLREQWKFNGVEPLLAQIHRDFAAVEDRQTLNPATPIVSDGLLTK